MVNTIPAALVVDVRDMLCSQALAVLAKAMATLPASSNVDVIYSADDVRHDLQVWAESRGYHLSEPNLSVLRIETR